MHWKQLAALGLAGAALCLGAPLAWGGTASRVWVSGHGTDHAGCGAPTAPCRSLQYAHDNVVVAGGEIDILDPAGYGAVTVTKSVSIVNDGVGTAGVQASGRNAIDINTGQGDSVYLKGLNIDGLQEAGLEGISFNSGTHLVIVDCVVRHFLFSGILLDPTSGFPKVLISGTTASDNTGSGITYTNSEGTAAMQLVIDHVLANDNASDGVDVDDDQNGFGEVSINSSTLTNNSIDGLSVIGNLVVGVDLSVMQANSHSGVYAASGAILHLSRSALTQNGALGVDNDVNSTASVFTTGDNRMFGNNQAATDGQAPVFEAPL